MFLQGDLQKVFDALYHLGVIDPVLDMDWQSEFSKIEENPVGLVRIVKAVNQSCGDHFDLMEELKDFAQHDLSHLAMLVAKELAGFHTAGTVH